jgi:predicted aspartyl protease
MFRVRYSTALRPAAPVIWVTLFNPNGGVPDFSVEAQLDTGADRTVFPTALLAELRLERYADKEFAVVGGVVTLTTYLLGVRVPGVGEYVIEAAASADEPRLLLGRDVLNCLLATLDGPARTLELSTPPAPPPATP